MKSGVQLGLVAVELTETRNPSPELMRRQFLHDYGTDTNATCIWVHAASNQNVFLPHAVE